MMNGRETIYLKKLDLRKKKHFGDAVKKKEKEINKKKDEVYYSVLMINFF